MQSKLTSGNKIINIIQFIVNEKNSGKRETNNTEKNKNKKQQKQSPPQRSSSFTHEPLCSLSESTRAHLAFEIARPFAGVRHGVARIEDGA